MSMQAVDQTGFNGFNLSSLRGKGPYEPSIASSASSSQASIFSDSNSVQSSIASSISDDFRHNQEDARDRAFAQAQLHFNADWEASKAPSLPKADAAPPTVRSYADITSLPKEQRQHPRRCSLSRNQKPPTLTRQCERKTSFVDSLVDSATQMVEVIWPLSGTFCRTEGPTGRGVLPLRTYIEETLRRSRTSYSTLQVALYYLILIKPFIPKNDFTMEQSSECPAERALMCGRRMFLAALILASKYLQDRNYSAKAWSKMSGLKVTEINTNERTFLGKVNWKLHIPEPIFRRWTEVVLKYTPNTPPPSPTQTFSIPTATWKSIISELTPELDNIPLPEPKYKLALECTGNYGFAPSPTTPTPPRTALSAMQIDSTSHESTPTPLTVLPRFLEPKPDLAPPTPALARMGPLPTPQLTPSSVASSTPAVSACGSRRSSMSSAMALAQRTSINRCTIDTFPIGNLNKENCPPASRRPSVTSAASSRSSPESMISDRSRSSRASSISSISTVSSTSSLAPHRACLARQATCRNARLPMPPATVAEEKEGTVGKPIIIADDTDMVSSPEIIDFTVNEKAVSLPHRHTKYAPHATSATSTEKCRKRGRPRSGRRSDLQEDIRLMLEEEMMEVDDDEDVASPSLAVDDAMGLLPRRGSVIYSKEVQPAASLSRRGSCRIPVQNYEGSKRICRSTSMSISPVPLYCEVA